MTPSPENRFDSGEDAEDPKYRFWQKWADARTGYFLLAAHELDAAEPQESDSPYFLQDIVEEDVDGAKVKYRLSYIKLNAADENY